MEEYQKHGKVAKAARCTAMLWNTAAKYLKAGQLPSATKMARTWRTRQDPFEVVLSDNYTCAGGAEITVDPSEDDHHATFKEDIDTKAAHKKSNRKKGIRKKGTRYFTYTTHQSHSPSNSTCVFSSSPCDIVFLLDSR